MILINFFPKKINTRLFLIVFASLIISGSKISFSKTSEDSKNDSSFKIKLSAPKDNTIKLDDNEKFSENNENISNLDKYFYNSLSIGIGKISGLAHEIVYNNGKKTSHLEWNFKDVKMVNLNYDRQLKNNFGVNIGFSSSINEGSNKSSLIDSDWLIKPYDDGLKYPHLWSHRSFGRITVKQIHKLDIHGYLSEFRNSIFFKLGYRYEKYKFNDNAYNYIYSNNSYHDTVGSFGGVRGISYQQNFDFPYVGIDINKKFNNDKIIFNIYGNYSPIARAKDIDLHHMTNTEFTGYYDNIKYYNWGSNLSTRIYPNLYLGTSFDYTYYALTSGYMIIENFNKKTKYRTKDNSAGISNKNTQYSIFLKYNFNSKI